MRALFATTAGEGHFGPMVPFARACAAAGHEVRVAAPASFARAVERAGFGGARHLLVPDAPPDEMGAIFGRLPHMSFDEANATVLRDVFAGVDARSVLPALAEAVDGWRPDLVVRESAEFASYVVAERRGIPHVEVVPGTAGLDTIVLPLVGEALQALGAERGAAGLWATPMISVVPEVLDDPPDERRRLGLPVRTVHRFRYEAAAPATTNASPDDGRALPAPWGDPEAPLVYASFGTVAATMPPLFPPLYRAVVDAAAELPVRLLLTLGEPGDPAALGPLPANVHVERFRRQHDVMPHTSAVIGHGGFGTTMTGLAHGVPQVVLPLFAADQRVNAVAVARAGAGRWIDGLAPGAGLPDPAVLAAGLPDAVTAVVAEPAYRDRARAVAEEMAALPAPAAAVALFEDLAAASAP